MAACVNLDRRPYLNAMRRLVEVGVRAEWVHDRTNDAMPSGLQSE